MPPEHGPESCPSQPNHLGEERPRVNGVIANIRENDGDISPLDITEGGQLVETGSNDEGDHDFISQVGVVEDGGVLDTGADGETTPGNGNLPNGNGQANHLYLNGEDAMESVADSQFGDAESNGDIGNDAASLWNDSDASTLNELLDRYGGEEWFANPARMREIDEANTAHQQWLLRQLTEAGMRQRAAGFAYPTIDNPQSLNGNGHEGSDSGEISPSIRPTAFLGSLIAENRRIPTGIDPTILFDSDSDKDQGNGGPFSVPGQIWEDPPSNEQNVSMVEERRVVFHGSEVHYPPVFDEDSDENKENVPPQPEPRLVNNSNVLDENSSTRAAPSRFDPAPRNHISFGPLQPRPSWANE
ncbi:hypothetical protein PRK78_004370 [Emydomyces testavorans]|uniref:Uncharacterized protein n=1 Tax=Emydomyces testavorans TaxID=2070801 RepID=A0AAF0IJG9_9EURO|nr:hypothetical protein PRK78_004370 [Emydomyces testavorans]